MPISIALRGRVPVGLVVAAYLFSCATSRGQNGFVNWETPHVSPLALTPSGATLLCVNTADNRLEIFDIIGGLPVWSGSIPVGLDPVTVRARSDTEAWVINNISDSISIVDLTARRISRTVLTGDAPCDVVFAGTLAGRAFVSLAQPNQVRVYDAANPDAAFSTIAIAGEKPRAMAASADGSRVFVAIFESGNTTSAVRQQDVSLAASPYAGRNPPPNSGNAFDPPIAAGLTAPPPVAQIVRRASDGTWRDDNNANWSSLVTWNILDHDVAIINSSTLAVTYADSLMTNIMAIGVRPDGVVTVVGTEARNQIRFEPKLAGVFALVEIGSFNPALPSATSVGDLNPHLTYQAPTIPQAQRNLSIGDPRGIAWHPTSGRAYISGMGSNNIIVSDSSGTRYAQIGVGNGPTGLALSGGGGRLYVYNKFDASISTIDTAANSVIATTPFYDPTPSVIKEGRPLLYDTHLTSGLGHLSCATCHIDGRTDFLAWDLGNPAGSMKAFDENCRQANCRPWHPMKGPMVTQSLQGIVSAGAMHWRGDRQNIAEFSGTFGALQGAESTPSSAAMQQFEAMIASIVYGPNPNLNPDGSFPAAIPTSGGGNGVPATGSTLYSTLPVLAGGLACNFCHALPKGTSNLIDDPQLALAPQPVKTVQLRGLWEKVGWSRASQNNIRGFGFNHQSEFDTLNALLLAGFNFGTPAVAPQRRRDVEAFLLCFPSDTHAGVGQQITFMGSNNSDAASINRLAMFTALADQGAAGLVAKGRVAGIDRGYYYTGSGVFASDRAAETTTTAALRTGASGSGEMTFTVVPIGTQRRIGVDRDIDGYFDRDELDAGSDPADPTSTPITACRPHITTQPSDVAAFSGSSLMLSAVVTGASSYRWSKNNAPLSDSATVSGSDSATLSITSADLSDAGTYFVTATNSCGVAVSDAASISIHPPCLADFNTDGGVDGADIGTFFDYWEAGSSAADVNDDGGIDGADVSYFFSAWEGASC